MITYHARFTFSLGHSVQSHDLPDRGCRLCKCAYRHGLPCSLRHVGFGKSILNGIDPSTAITDWETTGKLRKPLQNTSLLALQSPYEGILRPRYLARLIRRQTLSLTVTRSHVAETTDRLGKVKSRLRHISELTETCFQDCYWA